jgi:hypothetical protein
VLRSSGLEHRRYPYGVPAEGRPHSPMSKHRCLVLSLSVSLGIRGAGCSCRGTCCFPRLPWPRLPRFAIKQPGVDDPRAPITDGPATSANAREMHDARFTTLGVVVGLGLCIACGCGASRWAAPRFRLHARALSPAGRSLAPPPEPEPTDLGHLYTPAHSCRRYVCSRVHAAGTRRGLVSLSTVVVW